MRDKMNFINNIKILFVRGYIFLIITALCFFLQLARTFKYGVPASIVTDPNDPKIEDGYRYMPIESYDKFYHTYRLINLIAFLSGIIGIALYLWWKKRSKGET
jgi:hypothetical protein